MAAYTDIAPADVVALAPKLTKLADGVLEDVVAYVNIVGGQDDLVFDGDSVVVDQKGAILARVNSKNFSVRLNVATVPISPVSSPMPPGKKFLCSQSRQAGVTNASPLK